jgi:hypothetical protein
MFCTYRKVVNPQCFEIYGLFIPVEDPELTSVPIERLSTLSDGLLIPVEDLGTNFCIERLSTLIIRKRTLSKKTLFSYSSNHQITPLAFTINQS